MRVAFAEAVIFGERDLELAYLIPINLFHSAQHDLGDEDNALMSFDVAWIPYAQWKLYGELLIDDITFNKLGTDFYGNKLGWLGGVSYVQPFGLKNFDLTLEMAQLRPFIYTHQYPVNVYSHWRTPLGYRFQPNAEVMFFSVGYRPHRRAVLKANWTSYLHGAYTVTYNAGGDIFSPHTNNTSEEAPFLGGVMEKMNQIDLEGRVELLVGLYLWSRGAWIDYDGEDSWEWEVGFRFN